jgi:ribosome recycling factor
MISDILSNTEIKMRSTTSALKRELAAIRTGHATPAFIEYLKVDYGGATTPLEHIASISAPEANLLIIQPWDPNGIKDIEKALLKSNLGLTPSNDGKLIRLNIPPLSEERRLELTKVAKRRVEEGKVVIRNSRRNAADELKQLEKNKEISQDEHKRTLNQLQKLTDSFTSIAHQIGVDKEAALAEV